ncbi:MAG TPA: outer membrane beta-barrel protein [Pyrinomonadaceae bacterium]|nr:outer membrane beta-barrel protein [Pyrinomonadaceae bacterium]
MNKQHGCAAALVFLCLFFADAAVRAQATDAPKVEVGVQFTSLTMSEIRSTTEPGVGARVTYNLTDNVALEAQFDFFPGTNRFRGFRNSGQITQGLFGVKAGKRYEKFGLFGKVRPGFTSFSSGRLDIAVFNPSPDPLSSPGFVSVDHRETHFATDVGAVLEFYPTRRIVTRFDAGDTIIRYGDTTRSSIRDTGGLQSIPIRGETKHNFQFSAGIGFRF